MLSSELFGSGQECWTDSMVRFFKYPYYDDEILQWTEDNKEPSGWLETLSLRGASLSAPEFTGPVLVLR